jgi:hypothetical protein
MKLVISPRATPAPNDEDLPFTSAECEPIDLPAGTPASFADSRTPEVKTAGISQRVKMFLRSLDRTIYQMSQATSRPPFGKGTRAYIRDAFYAEIDAGQMPDIHQVAALARITGYRLIDWLTLFGYRIDEVMRLQIELQRERTVLLPSTLYDPLRALPWVRRLDPDIDFRRTQPVATVIEALTYLSLGIVDRFKRRRVLYARVGRRDDMMWPHIGAGSIVRVDPSQTRIAPVGGKRAVYLVQHIGGLCCSYVERLDDQYILLLPEDNGSSAIRYRVGTEAAIIGTIDLELRPLQPSPIDVAAFPRERSRNMSRIRPLDPESEDQSGPGVFVRTARERAGICFREAHALTRYFAAHFDDEHYSIALGSLSDVEAYDALPRHIPKILSLCIVYGMDLWRYLRAGGITLDALDGMPIPEEFLKDKDCDAGESKSVHHPNGFEVKALENVTAWLGDVPAFLLRSIGTIIGHDKLSLDDLYLWGGEERATHLVLQGAVLIFVNRRQRRIPEVRQRLILAERPLFLIRTATGQLTAGMCSIDGDMLLIYPHNPARSPVLSFRAQDTEVIGRISAVLRSIGTGRAAPAQSSTPPVRVR